MWKNLFCCNFPWRDLTLFPPFLWTLKSPLFIAGIFLFPVGNMAGATQQQTITTSLTHSLRAGRPPAKKSKRCTRPTERMRWKQLNLFYDGATRKDDAYSSSFLCHRESDRKAVVTHTHTQAHLYGSDAWRRKRVSGREISNGVRTHFVRIVRLQNEAAREGKSHVQTIFRKLLFLELLPHWGREKWHS